MASQKIRIVSEKSDKEFTYEEIVEMMKIAKTQNRLADMLGVDPDTITNTKAKDKAFSDAIAEGKRAWTKPVVDALYKQAIEKGDIGAQKYILNNHEPEEWCDKSKVENTIKGISHETILNEIENANANTKPTE